jgi:hypothetical protein
MRLVILTSTPRQPSNKEKSKQHDSMDGEEEDQQEELLLASSIKLTK